LFKAWFSLTMPKRYKFVAISENVRSFVSLNLGIPLEQIKLLRYGIDVAARPSPLGSRANLGLPQNAFLVAFIGRLVPQKNLLRFCQALKLAPKVHGVLVGAGPLEAELREFAAQEHTTNLSFIGPLDEASRYMHLFDLICLPSIHEGLGLVLLEAMAAGVPVCGARAGAIPEVLDNGALGALFSPLEPATMADCFNQSLSSPQQIKSIALSAQKAVQDRYAPIRVVEGYFKVYSS
jgi:glycosyltransferase involved in cell wall biosynthesis